MEVKNVVYGEKVEQFMYAREWFDKLVEDCEKILDQTRSSVGITLIKGAYLLGKRISEDYKKFGRKEHGNITQEMFASKLGVRQQRVSEWLRTFEKIGDDFNKWYKNNYRLVGNYKKWLKEFLPNRSRIGQRGLSQTKIEWTEFTWNPITGCLNVCPWCYARDIANSLCKKRYLSNTCIIKDEDPSDPFTPRFWNDRLDEPLKKRKPTLIFTVDMGEMFGPWVPREWIKQVLDTCSKASWHTFQLLTKFPENMSKWNPFPSNIWCGTTVTRQEDVHRIYELLKVEAPVKFVSFEPLHGEISHPLDGLDWIIIGEETKLDTREKKRVPCNPPKWEWVHTLIKNAKLRDTPVFIKRPLIYRLQEFPRSYNV